MHVNGTSKGGWFKDRKNQEHAGAKADFRRLALQLHHDTLISQNLRSMLLVTPDETPLSGQGALALGTALSEELRHRVLLIDLDAGPGGLAKILQCDSRPGWTDLLINSELPLADTILATSCPNLSFMTAGGGLKGVPLGQLNTASVLQSAEANHDMVLLAGGSVLHNPLALSVAPLIGTVLLLVGHHETKVDDLNAAQNVLSYCGASRLRLILVSGTAAKVSGR